MMRALSNHKLIYTEIGKFLVFQVETRISVFAKLNQKSKPNAKPRQSQRLAVIYDYSVSDSVT